MPLAAARSSARTASSVVGAASEPASVSDRRALTTSVLTSERAARLRTARRAPARACFLADAVRLATCHHAAGRAQGALHYKRGETHADRIIGTRGVRAWRTAPEGASRRLHRTNRGPHR